MKICKTNQQVICVLQIGIYKTTFELRFSSRKQ